MIVALADADDGRGFALAGAAVRRCRTAADVTAALDATATGGSASFVMVSAGVYALAPAAIDAWRARPDAPLVLVLPKPERDR